VAKYKPIKPKEHLEYPSFTTYLNNLETTFEEIENSLNSQIEEVKQFSKFVEEDKTLAPIPELFYQCIVNMLCSQIDNYINLKSAIELKNYLKRNWLGICLGKNPNEIRPFLKNIKYIIRDFQNQKLTFSSSKELATAFLIYYLVLNSFIKYNLYPSGSPRQLPPEEKIRRLSEIAPILGVSTLDFDDVAYCNELRSLHQITLLVIRSRMNWSSGRISYYYRDAKKLISNSN